MATINEKQKIVSSFISGNLKLRVNYEPAVYGQHVYIALDSSISLTIPRDILLLSPLLLEQIVAVLAQYM